MLSIIVGFALLRSPFQSVEVFIFVLGIFWLVQGVMTFVAAFAQKQGRNWRIISGLLGIIAGIIILTYPISSAVTLAFIGGIWLVILGIMQIVAGFQLRRAPASSGRAGPPERSGRRPACVRPPCYPVARRRPGAHDARGLGLARDPASLAPA